MEINTTNNGETDLHGQPGECPFCHNTIVPHLIIGHRIANRMEVVMSCPSQRCQKLFIAYYELAGGRWGYSGQVSQGTIVAREFNQVIREISIPFTVIYNQAHYAEQTGLTEICGVEYRKALEFLIKDYSILNQPDQKEIIEKKLLGPCIDAYVNDDRIKIVAKRAVWLGNDETHYVRKWEGKNLQDLKKLIDLTIHWIEMEALTKSFEEEMAG